ncbi:hypothetical protein ONZ51_g10925 [Trametes cubensis]|uniref:Uncharacterized protein n=1 Tax=Trametes cubensis TaxID=1111947 RepID=A0AAD7TII8_9APHY|nr:hypothetical protein ONZ51_g10925 [Trametes cubensis]
MAKSKKPPGVSRTVRKYLVQPVSRSSASTVVRSTRLGPVALQQAKEEGQRRLNEAISGLSGSAVEQIRDLHSRNNTLADTDGASVPEASHQDLCDVEDLMDVDDWVDEEDAGDMGNEVILAMRDLMGDR